MKTALLLAAALLGTAITSKAQVNSGSDGHDGAFNPTQNVEIDMANHPDGIYHYTSVNIPSGVTVTFKPNAANTPVVWLAQNSCTIAGSINIAGKMIDFQSYGISGAPGGPGGYQGGHGPLESNSIPQPGFGPGGGKVDESNLQLIGGSGSYGTLGNSTPQYGSQHPAGELYGSDYLLPLIGGSGGGGGKASNYRNGGGGGGGAILISASNLIEINGSINASGGGASSSSIYQLGGGGGSGGGVRLVSSVVRGSGSISTSGGRASMSWGGGTYYSSAGKGRIRIDAHDDRYSGGADGVITRGFQPVIIPPAGQAVALSIKSVGGSAVIATPTGNLTSPDVIVPAAQQNPVSIVVGCTNIPLGSEIIVDVKPANGPAIRAVGLNNTGTQVNSTATVQVQMPRGGGIIQAKAVSGIQLAANDDANAEHLSLAQTGWTADGERFKFVEVTAGLGAASQLAYITESGKRYALSSR